MNQFRTISRYIIYLFAVVGFVLTVGYITVKYGFSNTSGIIDRQSEVFMDLDDTKELPSVWKNTPETEIFKMAVKKDAGVLARVEKDTGIKSRVLVSILFVEQIRLFFTERAIFEKVFAPLKILGSQSQFSWGIMGIKDDTARMVEANLKYSACDFYPGVQYEDLLNFKTDNVDSERFSRIIDEDDHYYSYLYSALYLKQIVAQWQSAGFDISDKVEILATLYNIGFANSKPKGNPQAGGAEIEINGQKSSFGMLAWQFYNSDQLLEEFPK